MRSTHQRITPPSCPTHPTQSTTVIKGTHPTRRLKAQICCWTNRSGVFVISALIHWLTAFEYVDQAVNILSEIWRPQDVPDVFKAPSKGLPLGSALGHAMPLSAHQSLPSMALSSHTSQPPTSIAAMMAHQHSSFTSPMFAWIPQTVAHLRNSCCRLPYLKAIALIAPGDAHERLSPAAPRGLVPPQNGVGQMQGV